jgi:O-antigen ligase
MCISIRIANVSIFPSQTIDKFNAAVTNATQFVDNEDGNKKQPSGTASERFIFWKVAINTARKHPFFGSGSGFFWVIFYRLEEEFKG